MADWMADLEKLKQRPPSKNVKKTIINVMVGPSDDRTAALLAAALVDASLVRPIAVAARPPNAQEIRISQTLLSSDFAAKIKKAFTHKLIGPNTKKNLEVIKEVRNAFAHSFSEIEFTTPEVERACAMLTLPPNKTFYVDPAEEPKREGRYRYCIACDAVFQAMLHYIGVPWATGSGWPSGPPTQPLLP
jgi:hypothetical protein